MDISKLQAAFSKFSEEDLQVKDRNNRILIIDGLNLFIRAFAANPAMNHRGDHVGGLVGFLKSLFSLIQKFRPTRCILVFDGIEGSKRRREKFPAYKEGRKNKDSLNRYIEVDGVLDETEGIKNQFSRLEQYLHVLPMVTMSINYLEADDTIAYIVNQYLNKVKYGNITIVSSDKDFLQLVTDKVHVYSPVKKKLYDSEVVYKEFGFVPKNYLTYRVLTGDDSDNIPGVNGMGLKTLLKYFPEIAEQELNIDDIMEMSRQKIDSGSKMKIYEKIILSENQVNLNLELMQLTRAEVPSNKQTQIDRILDEPIYHLDKIKFKQMLYHDGLNDHFNYVDSRLYSTLTQLDINAEA